MKDEKPDLLIAHPDPATRTSLYSLLEGEGFRVATCASGIEALKYLSAHKPAVLIASTHLPDTGVRSFLGDVARASLTPCTVLLAGPDDWELFINAPDVVEVVPWPGRKSEILSSVRRILETAAL
jgi:CheY-like chemotaxis protein